DRHLDFRRTGVALDGGVFGQQFLFALCSNRHRVFLSELEEIETPSAGMSSSGGHGTLALGAQSWGAYRPVPARIPVISSSRRLRGVRMGRHCRPQLRQRNDETVFQPVLMHRARDLGI